MIWKKITINTTTEASDVVASVLFDNGICGAEIEDNQNLSDDELKKMYVDIPVKKIDDGKAKVNFYVSIVEDKEIFDKNKNNVDNNIIDNSYTMSTDNIFTIEEFNNIMESIKAGIDEYKDFMDMGSLMITETELDDEIFLNKWKENFKRIDIDDVSIIPSWEKESDNLENNKLKIYIEPGSAFGTGQHMTTKLCVKAIKKIISEKNICAINSKLIDIGCGSGILGIVAKKLGINDVYVTDVDKTIEKNLIENIKLNNLNCVKAFSNNISGFKKVDKMKDLGIFGSTLGMTSLGGIAGKLGLNDKGQNKDLENIGSFKNSNNFKQSQNIGSVKDSFHKSINVSSSIAEYSRIMNMVDDSLGNKNNVKADVLNFENNTIKYFFGNLIDDVVLQEKVKTVKYNVAVANILAPVIISLIKITNIADYIEDGGYFICSGIIEEKENEVVNAINESGKLSIKEVYREDGWVAIVTKNTKNVK